MPRNTKLYNDCTLLLEPAIAAERLHMARATLTHLMDLGKVPFVWIGRRRLVHVEVVERIARDGLPFDSLAKQKRQQVMENNRFRHYKAS